MKYKDSFMIISIYNHLSIRVKVSSAGIGYLRKACFPRARFSLVRSQSIGFRGVWVTDSSSPHRVPYSNIENCHSLPPRRKCSFDPVTDKHIDKQTDRQTDRQTNVFNFVRPSFQSREYQRKMEIGRFPYA